MRRCEVCGAELSDEDGRCPVCSPDPGETTESFGPVPAEEKQATGEIGVAEVPVLVVRKGPDVGETFYLDRPRLTIGRDPECDIFLNDVTVSRGHAALEVAGGDVTVVDTGSLNGTYVNGERVDRARLCSGDALQVGRFQMIFIPGGGA